MDKNLLIIGIANSAPIIVNDFRLRPASWGYDASRFAFLNNDFLTNENATPSIGL